MNKNEIELGETLFIPTKKIFELFGWENILLTAEKVKRNREIDDELRRKEILQEEQDRIDEISKNNQQDSIHDWLEYNARS